MEKCTRGRLVVIDTWSVVIGFEVARQGTGERLAVHFVGAKEDDFDVVGGSRAADSAQISTLKRLT